MYISEKSLPKPPSSSIQNNAAHQDRRAPFGGDCDIEAIMASNLRFPMWYAPQEDGSVRQSNNHRNLFPVSTLTNEQLIIRCRRGDERAWNQLVTRYARLVHSIPVRYGLTPAEIDDVGQEVFLALAQGLATIDDPESLPAWLMTTARRYSWRIIQKRKRENPLAGRDLADAELNSGEHTGNNSGERIVQHYGRQVPSMGELLDGWQRQEMLSSGLARMGDRCRHLLTMVFLDPNEPSYDDISTELGIPKGSIGPTRNRCLQQLRTILEGLGFAGNK